ncbi:uncharacterized protein DS421_16g554850 [Arachis hypogaea]|nr:uncharacterized protein DS421_16g554850 [Arachis hypogaea]
MMGHREMPPLLLSSSQLELLRSLLAVKPIHEHHCQPRAFGCRRWSHVGRICCKRSGREAFLRCQMELGRGCAPSLNSHAEGDETREGAVAGLLSHRVAGLAVVGGCRHECRYQRRKLRRHDWPPENPAAVAGKLCQRHCRSLVAAAT